MGNYSLLERSTLYLSENDNDLIRKAFSFASDAHSGQYRDSGQEFITHPIAVTTKLAEYKVDASTLAAGLLHDVCEDTPVTIHQIQSNFGFEISTLVEAVTKYQSSNYCKPPKTLGRNLSSWETYSGKINTAILKDIRVAYIKLSDLLHNLSTMDAFSENRRHRFLIETILTYFPLVPMIDLDPIASSLLKQCMNETFNQLASKKHGTGS